MVNQYFQLNNFKRIPKVCGECPFVKDNSQYFVRNPKICTCNLFNEDHHLERLIPSRCRVMFKGLLKIPNIKEFMIRLR